MKKLIEILHAAGFEWPRDAVWVKQNASGFVNAMSIDRAPCMEPVEFELASDWRPVEITREQYAEYCEQRADGWIAWSGGECPVEGRTRVDVKFRGGDTEPGATADEYFWRRGCGDGDIIAYRLHVEPKPDSPRHTVYHDGEVYRNCELLLQTAQLTAWRCDGQEYAVRAHQAMIDPDDDQVAAALMSGITGHEIAPEHITELRAQMGWNG